MQRSPIRFALLATCALTAAFQHPPPAVGALLAAPASARQTRAVATRAMQARTASAVGPPAAHSEIRAFFDEYLRLHEQKDMVAFPKLFLEDTTIVRTGSDARLLRYAPAELAARIAAEAAKLDSQHETFEDVRIEADGSAAMYSTHWKLFHNGKLVRQGRAWFSLVKTPAEGDAARAGEQWRIASLVWYNH